MPNVFGCDYSSTYFNDYVLAKDIRWGACGSVMDFSNHDQLNHQCEVHYIPNDDVVRLMKDFFKDKR